MMTFSLLAVLNVIFILYSYTFQLNGIGRQIS
jgi:hypothetical protein